MLLNSHEILFINELLIQAVDRDLSIADIHSIAQQWHPEFDESEIAKLVQDSINYVLNEELMQRSYGSENHLTLTGPGRVFGEELKKG